MAKIVLALLVVSILLSACGPDPEDFNTPTPDIGCTPIGIPYHTLYRCVDNEAGVVCWAQGDSLFCLPIDETNLEGMKE